MATAENTGSCPIFSPQHYIIIKVTQHERVLTEIGLSCFRKHLDIFMGSDSRTKCHLNQYAYTVYIHSLLYAVVLYEKEVGSWNYRTITNRRNIGMF